MTDYDVVVVGSGFGGSVTALRLTIGHPGLHVVDGTAVSANLGANPSLTITAQAERAMAFWPNAGEPDPRPPLGAAYRPVTAVVPVATVTAYRPSVRGRTPA